MQKVRNLTGVRFGKLTVISELPERHVSSSGKTYARWHCRCDCGNEVNVIGTCLTSGGTKSCGCLSRQFARKPQMCDLSGRKFGKLTVIEKATENMVYPSGYKVVKWVCKCDCGNTFVTVGSALLSGAAKSCGCTWRCNIK